MRNVHINSEILKPSHPIFSPFYEYQKVYAIF